MVTEKENINYRTVTGRNVGIGRKLSSVGSSDDEEKVVLVLGMLLGANQGV